jgi:non-heme chloroperoxidase
MPTAERFLQRGAFKLHYRHTIVDPDGPTYVLLHGWSGNHTVFQRLEELLHKRGINTVAPDLRGHGVSSKHRKHRSDYAYKEYVQDLHALLTALELNNVTIFGYSAGGTIALMHELAYPGLVKQLVLVSSNHDNPFRYWHIGWATLPGKWILLATAWFVRPFDRRRDYKHIDLMKIKTYWGSVFEGLQTMPANVNLWLIANYATLRLGSELRRIELPTLILRGKGDQYFTEREAEILSHKLGNARAITLHDCDHYLVSRHGDRLMEELDKRGMLGESTHARSTL